MARLARHAWPALLVAWLVAFVAASAGSGAGGASLLPAMVLPAILLAAFALARLSIVDISRGMLAAATVSMASRVRGVQVLRSADPDAAGRPRPRAPGA
jgi:hypothetical protein